MNAPLASTLQNAPPVSRERFARIAAMLIILAGLAAYANSFTDAFVYDDIDSIVSNPQVRHLWPPWKFFVPLNRPVVNLSLAANYVLWGSSTTSANGLNVVPFHLFNLAVHILAALTLFGLIRRTLRLPALRPGSGQWLRARFEGAATPLALATALIWEVHPLQTESVTYIIQRAESLAGLFYLLTLYCLVRGALSDRPMSPLDAAQGAPIKAARRWYAAAFAACLLGMGAKQTVATAPLVALLYDRTFLSGAFREALRRRWALYLAMAATWLLLIPSVMSVPDVRRASAGFQLDISPFGYAVAQLGVILHYLRLSLWPAGLCLDCGWRPATTLDRILPGAIVIGALLAATAWALARRPAWGFLGASFFLILAPTSSFMPIADPAVEHRMYLPLAAVVAFAVIGGFVLFDRLGAGRRRARNEPAIVVCLVVAVLGYLTALRNLDYRSEFIIWNDTVRKAPENPRAYGGRGTAYSEAHDYAHALEDQTEAIRLNSNYAPAFNGRAITYNDLRQFDNALKDCNEAIRLDPDYAIFYNTRAVVLARTGQYEKAILDYNKAIALMPGYASAYMNRGVAYDKAGRMAESLADFDKALALFPNYPSAYYNRGNTYFDQDDYDRAIRDYSQAIALKPNYPDAYCNRASAYFWKKDYGRAWADVQALRNLGVEPPPQLLQQLKGGPPSG